jgi:hypothetical protein
MPHRAVQINPRKSKEIQIKRLGFPWIRLAETGLFNGLQPKKKEKFSPLQSFDAICLKRMPLIGLSPNVPSAGLDPTSEKRIARVRISVKKMQRKNLAPSRLALAQQSLGQPGRRP